MIISDIPMVLIFVSDVRHSSQWYQETLELPVLYRDDGFASLQVGSQRLGLHAADAAGHEAPQAGSTPVFGVADYQQTKALLESRGCQFDFENQTPNAIFGSFSDPDGNPLQIMQSLGVE